MARFVVSVTGTPDTLEVHDSAHTPWVLVLQMPKADLHRLGSGSTGSLANLDSVEMKEVQRAFETPYGTQLEMGFDLELTLSAAGTSKEVGYFTIFGMRLGNTVDRLDTHVDGGVNGGFKSLTGAQSKLYPGATYSPLEVFRGSSAVPYNVCVSMCFAVLDYNHPLRLVAEKYGVSGTTITNVYFEAREDPPSVNWATIPAGETRVYSIAFRINDRTNTKIGPATDAAEEWLWTVRGYQQYFRQRYGKPNYRSMGGFDGRPIASMNSSSGVYNATTNPRSWQDLDPTTTTGGYGYYKFANLAVSRKSLNIDRVIMWAISGWHQPAYSSSHNYAFRFATGVLSLNSTATDTIRGALTQVRDDQMRQGLWWGRCTQVDDAVVWDPPAVPTIQLDPDDPYTAGLAYDEADLAILEWGTQIIGLDLYDFQTMPRNGSRWLNILNARYPRTLFITEQALPDIYHVLAPTYIIQGGGAVNGPTWLYHYICPGSECVLQLNSFGVLTAAARSTQVAAMGYTPIAFYETTLTENTRAGGRWLELGETAISQFRTKKPDLMWRSRAFRGRGVIR